MSRRQFLRALGGSVAAWPLRGFAQQAMPAKRIGLMGSQPLRPIEQFRKKLHQLGYIEGQNLIIEPRFAEGRDDRYPAFAAELAALPVDLIVAWGTPAALAAKRATTKIPIVLVAGDVLNTGIVSNLARPEGNITGFIAVNVELEEKRIELLKDVVPHLTRVAILGNSLNPLNRVNLDIARRAATKLSIEIETFEVQNSHEVANKLAALTAKRPDAVLIASDTLLLSERQRIVDALAAAKIPAIYPFREYGAAGGFIIYGANISNLFENAAVYVDRILKGEKPGDLPIQQATAFDVIINLKAAAKLGLTLPPRVLVRADEVIE
jgi:putative ABC transport system substrate-binding protein